MSEHPLSILVITVDWPPIEGGISTVSVELSRELVRMGYEVTVLAPALPGAEVFTPDPRIRVVHFAGYHWGWLRLFPLLAAAHRLAPHYDLILAMNITYGGIAGLLGRALFGVPYGTFAYAYEFLKFKKIWPVAAFLRYIYGQSRGVIAISNFTREQLVSFGVPIKRIAAIYPGARPNPQPSAAAIDLVLRNYPLDGKKLILSVGRMIPRKGHLTLVRALPRILKRVPDAHLFIVGQGPEVSACSRAAQRMGIRENVTFAGRLSDNEVQALYHICNVFALPTGTDRNGQVEGFGLVFTEAHAHAKPVVAGRSGGVVDAVRHEETGLLVNPNTPDDTADAIIRLLLHEDFAERLGATGKDRVERELNWHEFTVQMLFALGVKQ